MQSELSIKLKELRVSKNFTIKKLIAELSKYGLHYSSTNIYKWEEGVTIPNIKTIKALSRIYDCGISYFSDYEDQKFETAMITPYELHLLTLFRNNFLFRSIAMQLYRWYEDYSISD